MPLISPPNIYNTIFQDIDNELRTHITLSITEKIHEQMNLSFFYHATQLDSNKRNFNIDFSCEKGCVNEVFDLPQGCANAILEDIHD
jgi:hypothetical protein